MASRFLVPFGGRRGLMGRDDPFLDLHREMNRLFDDVYRGVGETGGAIAAPRLDVHETEGGLEISAEMPGVSQDDIDLRLDGDTLTIQGEKRNQRKDEKAQLVERSYGSFQRTVQLPFAPDPDQVEADCEHGVLTIRLPRPADQEKSRRIQIGRGRGEAARRTIEGESARPGGESAIGGDWQSRGQSQERSESGAMSEEQEKRGQGAPA